MWDEAQLKVPGGENWLNATIALAECFAESKGESGEEGGNGEEVSASGAVQGASSTEPGLGEATGGAGRGLVVRGVGAGVGVMAFGLVL